MARIVFVGGGVVGLCAAAMVATDGHQVTVLERDPAEPVDPSAAWEDWERRGVNQFRMIHLFLARFRQEIDAQLPGLSEALSAAGALQFNPVERIPESIRGPLRPDDGRFAMVTARRPVAEAVVAAFVATVPGLEVRRGVPVAGLLGETGPDGIVRVRGVRTEAGEELTADLVVDASGRRSPVAGWLRSIGSPGPTEVVEECGFVYYARHYRSDDGSIPAMLGGPLQYCGSLATLTLPADNGTWGVGVVAAATDTAMRALSDEAVWESVVRSHPLVAHWVDAEPMTDVKTMAKLEDRQRTYVVEGRPVATGIIPLADAYACTNPSLGRGVSMGMIHAAALRRLLREVDVTDAHTVALRWGQLTDETVRPYFEETLTHDRFRLAQVQAIVRDEPFGQHNPGWALSLARSVSPAKEPDLFRASLAAAMLLERESEVLGRPEIAARLTAVAATASTARPPSGLAPERGRLLELVGAGG